MKLLFALPLVPAALFFVSPPSTAQTAPNAGAAAFGTCRACHTLNKGGKSTVGPNLHGLFGRQAGAVAGFKYSPALKASKIQWNDKTLNAYLEAPTKVVPGTRMVVRVTDPKRRAALIQYLKAETAK